MVVSDKNTIKTPSYKNIKTSTDSVTHRKTHRMPPAANILNWCLDQDGGGGISGIPVSKLMTTQKIHPWNCLVVSPESYKHFCKFLFR